MKIYGIPDAYNPTRFNIVDDDLKLYSCLVNKTKTMRDFKLMGTVQKNKVGLGNTGLGSLVSKPPKSICIAIRNKIKALSK